MKRLNQPLKAWHELVAIVLAVILGASASAIATGAVRGAATPSAGKALLARSHGYFYVHHRFTNFANDVTQGVVNCGRGKVVVGGGGLAGSNNTPGSQELNSSYPHISGTHGQRPDGWAVFMDNMTGQDQTADVFAVCKKVR
jgi:hypothetical protein